MAYNGMYVIMPNSSWWERQNYKTGKRLPEGFVYTSNTNDEWLNIEDLKKIVYGSVASEEESVSKFLSSIHQLNDKVILNMLNSKEHIPEALSVDHLLTDNGQRSFIPYARQQIDEDDIQAVVEVLRSDWLTTGPKVVKFEQAVADFVGAKEAVAVSSGTAALHAAMYAIGIELGDEVIVPPMTFVATANAVVFQGGTAVFADIDPDTLLIDTNEVETKITPRTKAIIAVDYAGHLCAWDRLRDIADRHGLRLVADGCHALGAEYKGQKVGSLAVRQNVLHAYHLYVVR